MSETVIPILPCASIADVLAFYRAIGFEVTHEQTRPNPFAVVERGDIRFQFFTIRGYDPAASYSTCYVLSDDVDALYEAFRSGLKRELGRVPTRGLPRLGPVKDMPYGVRQFLMTDPGGNTIRLGTPNGGPAEYPRAPKEPIARALHIAGLLGDSKGDVPAAARVVDRALDGDAVPAPDQLLRLLVLRADLALREGRAELAADLLARAGRVRGAGESAEVRDARRRAGDLAAELA
ncbi:bleomycin resistance protein [Nocardiopsis mangrovi]|uniref:Bleomycin resistance protein n=1 Tax=Nocardiopsis mangrovi TaxID=1179818 RepID=A0ABV9E662_9ACTN